MKNSGNEFQRRIQPDGLNVHLYYYLSVALRPALFLMTFNDAEVLLNGLLAGRDVVDCWL